MLSTLITSKSRVELLTWFFAHPGERFHYTQLSKILDARRPSIQKELKRLEDAGILLSQKDIRAAFIYGSVAKNREDARSDIDLMIIGDVNQEGLHAAVSAAEAELGREVNYSIFDLEDWKGQLAARKAFVTDMAAGPKIFLVGDEDALR